jgi:hypothetical protein
MANFLNYRNVAFKLEDKNYYATKVSLSAKANVDPVILNDGSLLNYAPQSSVVGSLSTDFYLTGALPDFLRITGFNESSITANFASVTISNVYPKSISFSVEPFQPILISAEFDWYGNVEVEDFTSNTNEDKNNIQIPSYFANGYRSSLTTSNLEGVDKILSFDYSASCERPSFFHINDIIPFRVAKLNRSLQLSLKSNDLGGILDIDGKNVNSTVSLRDTYGTVLDTFSISGILLSQNYEVSEGQYLLASADIEQTVTQNKTLV